MNKLTLTATLALTLATTALCRAQDNGTPITPMPSTSGQTQAPAQGMGQGMGQGRQMDPNQVLNAMATRLSLTDAQKTQLLPILTNRQTQMKTLMADSGSRRDKFKEMKSLQESTDKQINAILTPDQQKQYAKLEEERKEQMKNRMAQRKAGGAN